MSSRFVSTGTTDDPIERDDEWRAAQAEIEEKRRQQEEYGKQEGGKSLYDVLQANKAAKQDAFEEAARLKNQFRGLNDSEAEFLDSVLEATRKQEVAIKAETLEQLDLFRQHQEELERKALIEANTDKPVNEGTEQWKISGRKRKKGHGIDGSLLKGAKLRKTSTSEGNVEARKVVADTSKEQSKGTEAQPHAKDNEATPKETSKTPSQNPEAPRQPPTAVSPPNPTPSMALNLGYGDSDDDD
ncbi:hypothetical protein EJ04DRAFT_576092 [Polyplosphaeria fusca]|uniref:FAM192A/Fyv6 N-terminal domain-containing protein n=1 Tax=Polyplosphaeria fusca TaxID=682080 RepID=A0A9P4R259_9PLEO|nr:hypothetical protein EJ04DRAFT_576092 [Polyplosphaeria fusca]